MSTKEKNEAGRGWKWLVRSGKAVLRKVTFEQRPGEDGAVSMQDLGKSFQLRGQTQRLGWKGERSQGQVGGPS